MLAASRRAPAPARADEDECDPLDSSEEEIVRTVAKEFVKKPIADHPRTQNDKELSDAEAKMDRVEAAIEQLHREENVDEYSPIVTGVKEARLLESFRYFYLSLNLPQPKKIASIIINKKNSSIISIKYKL